MWHIRAAPLAYSDKDQDPELPNTGWHCAAEVFKIYFLEENDSNFRVFVPKVPQQSRIQVPCTGFTTSREQNITSKWPMMTELTEAHMHHWALAYYSETCL